jgi:hypothetical protein
MFSWHSLLLLLELFSLSCYNPVKSTQFISDINIMNETIFECLLKAGVVGGLATSMQWPDIDKDVILKAIQGQFDLDAVALTLSDGSDLFPITVGELKDAVLDGYAWVLPSGENLWIN